MPAINLLISESDVCRCNWMWIFLSIFFYLCQKRIRFDV